MNRMVKHEVCPRCGSAVSTQALRAVKRINTVQLNKEVQSIIDTIEKMMTILSGLREDAKKLWVEV